MNFATIGHNIVKLTIKYWDKFLLTGMGYTLSLAAITVAVGAILGSLIALIPFLAYPVIIVRRIKNEEQVLERELAGYTDYKARVKYRLIPHCW